MRTCLASLSDRMILTARSLLVLSLFLSLSPMLCHSTLTGPEGGPGKKIRHQKKVVKSIQKGTYKTKEEIEKAPSEDHPCNLTRTSVKISFPAMKSELFVNFLGYREPNLMYIMRCKGLCGDEESPTACAATRVKQKKVKMMVKTHFQGRDEKEKWKELILDEHVECGCKCRDMSASQCAGRFNALTCECECEERFYGEEKMRCESRVSTYWDSMACQCRSKSVAPRGVDSQEFGCIEHDERLGYNIPRDLNMLDILSYIVLGSCITTAMFLSATTFYYRRKYKQLLKREQEGTNKSRTTEHPKNPVWKHPSHSYRNTNGYKVNTTERAAVSANNHHNATNFQLDLSHALLSPEGGDLYHEQYDEHGVRIERPVSDAELLRHYMG